MRQFANLGRPRQRTQRKNIVRQMFAQLETQRGTTAFRLQSVRTLKVMREDLDMPVKFKRPKVLLVPPGETVDVSTIEGDTGFHADINENENVRFQLSGTIATFTREDVAVGGTTEERYSMALSPTKLVTECVPCANFSVATGIGYFVIDDEFRVGGQKFFIGSINSGEEETQGSGGSQGDPHLHFADGGVADFRGKNNQIYSVLSAPDFAFNMRTQDTSFMLPKPRMVDGSFFTQAFWTVRTSAKEMYHIFMQAAQPGYIVYSRDMKVVNNRSGQMWHGYAKDDLNLLMKQSTLYLRCAGWETNVTRKPIYNKISGPSNWRFDMTIRPLDDTGITKNGRSEYKKAAPHGLVGQSYDNDGISVSGKIDLYETTVVKTTAMAEGAIEGVASDYEMIYPYSTVFKYSRFSKPRGSSIATRNITKLSGAKVRKSDTEGSIVAGSTEYESDVA